MGQTWILAVSGDADRHGVARAGNRDALSPSTPSKEHPGERETPHKTVEECTVDSVSILSAKEPAPCTLQGAPTGCLCTASLCKGGVSKNNSMLSPKLLCLPLCHKLHVTSHSRESVHSVTLGHPDEATKTELRVLPGLSDDQATYLLPAEPAVPIESSHLSGLSGSGLLEHLLGAEPFLG